MDKTEWVHDEWQFFWVTLQLFHSQLYFERTKWFVCSLSQDISAQSDTVSNDEHSFTEYESYL